MAPRWAGSCPQPRLGGLAPDEPDVVRLRPVDGSDTEAVESLGQAVLEFLCRESALRLQRRRPVHPASVATINALLLG